MDVQHWKIGFYVPFLFKIIQKSVWAPRRKKLFGDLATDNILYNKNKIKNIFLVCIFTMWVLAYFKLEIITEVNAYSAVNVTLKADILLYCYT